ncbi:hypothetical protein A3Q56_06394 [Intoshia linei]|uniref:Uncharacterized protein n=1 Tax=Intoshia linei TaxID=1819745 RepID=A0A177AV64_9BILA|nr:hypothetical protein A3Q56_06394 [Intoshia linei]
MNTMMQRYKEEINTAHENAIQLLVEQNKRMQKKRRFEKNTKISQIDVKVCPNRKINQISATKIKPSVVDKSRKSSALSLKLRQLETDVNIKEDTISQLTEQNFKYNGMIQYVVKVVVDFEKLQINKMEEFKAFFNAEAIQISEKMNKMFNNLKKKVTLK